MKSQQVRNAKT